MKKLDGRIRISELADTSLRIVDVYKGELGLENDSFLKPLFGQLDEFTDNMIKSLKSDNTVSKLKGTDKLRDESLKNLQSILKGYKAMRNPEVKTAAEYLLEIFGRYGLKVIRENYASQSAHMESMLKDFSTPEARKNIKKLSGVEETISELQERQMVFNKDRVAYEKSMSKEKKKPSATSLKKPMLDLINLKLVPFLTAMGQKGAYENLYGVVQQIISGANEVVARRKTRAAKK